MIAIKRGHTHVVGQQAERPKHLMSLTPRTGTVMSEEQTEASLSDLIAQVLSGLARTDDTGCEALRTFGDEVIAFSHENTDGIEGSRTFNERLVRLGNRMRAAAELARRLRLAEDE
jgi:hypothetical protein